MRHRVNFSDADKRVIQHLRSQGMSYPALAERYNVCKDTIRGVIAGTWKPKSSKLPAEDSQLYLEYLMLGTYTAVARQYDVTEASVRKRIRSFMLREGL